MSGLPIGELAEEAAAVAQRGDAARMSEWLRRACDRHGVNQRTLTDLIAAEWDRLGIARVPRGTSVRV